MAAEPSQEKRLFDAALARYVGAEPDEPFELWASDPDHREEIVRGADRERATYLRALDERREWHRHVRRVVEVSAAWIAVFGVAVLLTVLFRGEVQITSEPVTGSEALDAILLVVIPGAILVGRFVDVQTGFSPTEALAGYLESIRIARQTRAWYVAALVEVALPEARSRFESERLRRESSRLGVRARRREERRAQRSSEPPLRALDASRLVQSLRSGAHVHTDALARVQRLVEGLEGATIGIAGPRGVGKSELAQTLLDTVVVDKQHLTVSVAAPVRYEPREFVLTAFAATCEAVLGGRERERRLERWRLNGTVLASVLLGAGVGVYVSTGSIHGTTHHIVGEALFALGLLVAGMSWLPRRRPRRGALPRRTTNLELRMADPRAVVHEVLQEIRYQLTFTGGYEGKLTAAFGEVSAARSIELAQRQESYPDVVARFRAFLECAARAHGRVVIAIDELDKLPAEDAARFLNDIKAIFAVDGCFFVLSVSDDALRAFELRGIPARDAFDSALDEIVVVRPFSVAQSRRLIDSRTEGMPEELIRVCHVLAGGLPRDVIRHARWTAMASGQGVSATNVGRQLIHDDVAAKLHAVGAALREEDAGALARWMSAGGTVVDSASAFTTWLQDRPTDESTSLPRDLRLATAGATAFAYIMRTASELLLEEPVPGGVAERVADELAAARHELATDPHAAWTACTQTRNERRLEGGTAPFGVALV
jgi:hypothetical protein